MDVRIFCFGKGLIMRKITIVGKDSMKTKYENLNLIELEDIDKVDKLGIDNIFIFNSEFINEEDQNELEYTEYMINYLNKLFEMIKSISKKIISENKEGKIIFLTSNSNIQHFIKYPTSPTLDEAKHSLIRSLSKEFSAFKVSVFGLCLDPINEIISDFKLIKKYKKSMSLHGMKKLPININDIKNSIEMLIDSQSEIISGNIILVGKGSVYVN